MKVLMLNGSPKANGCTFTALTEVGKALEAQGVDYEIFQLGNKPQRDCIDCRVCRSNGTNKCVMKDDLMTAFLEKAREADGFIFGSPVYFAHASGGLISFLDRAFFSEDIFSFKPGAAVVSARRAGTTSALDEINKYFTIRNMPVVSSSYWNMVHGTLPADVLADKEGVQIMHNLGTNMAWLLKSIELGKQHGLALPVLESGNRTDFIPSV